MKNYSKQTAGTTFLLLALLNFSVSIIFSMIFLNDTQSQTALLFAFLLPQIANVGVVVWFYKNNKTKLIEAVKPQRQTPKFIGIAIILVVGVFFGIGFVNEWFVGLLYDAGLSAPEVNIPLDSVSWLLLDIVVICILPAIFEELIFRDILLKGFKGLGSTLSCITVGALFALFHSSASQTIYQFILGVILCLLAIKSNSVLPSIIFHFLNNFLAVILTYFFPTFDMFSPIMVGVGLTLFVLGLVLLIVSKTCKTKEDEILYNEIVNNETLKIEQNTDKNDKFLYGFFGVIYFAFLWIAGILV